MFILFPCKMYRLSVSIPGIALCVIVLAHQSKGISLSPGIQKENDSSAQHLLLHGQPKRNLTSLAANSIGIDSNSEDVSYYASYVGWGDLYFGLHATMDVYGHELKHGQSSFAQIRVGHDGDGAKTSLNSIALGWHIYPELYGDSHPHFFISWTRDGDEATGCYNMDCTGFIRANGAKVAPGTLIHPVSHVDVGHKQYITIKVFKDKESGDWWVYYGFNSVPTAVGYFPRSLFTYLAEKANGFSFGGYASTKRALPTPPMGSSALPNSGHGRAASFTNLQLIDQNGKTYPIRTDLITNVDNEKCYSITPLVNDECLYGGPGGCME